MSISYVNIDKKNNEPKLSLCLPNLERTKIGNLTDIYDAELTINMGILNELSFTMPMYVERNNQKVKNPLIEKFNGLYHVRVEWNDRTEYFVYTKGNRKLSSSGKEYQYRLLSIGHLLSKKYIAIYEEDHKICTDYIYKILENTGWDKGFVDVVFDVRPSDNKPNVKGFSVENSNVLSALFDLATKYGALITWDTVNKKVNFIRPESSGDNKGFKVREGVFLESLDAEINYDEIVTRLHVYGEDGLEFRRYSPTGVNYIESFDWFMHPFECDSNYNVLKSSKYLSDGLCVAIRKYEKKLADSTPQFEIYTTNKTTKQDEIQQREQELSVLKADLIRIHNTLDIINATYFNENVKLRPDWQNASSAEDAKLIEIQSKENQIATLNTQLTSIDGQIDTLKESLSIENNFTDLQIREREDYTLAKPYTNDSISDEKDLLEEGLKVFKQYNVPPTSLNISMVNFLKDFEFEKIKDRIAIGDTTTAKLEDFDLDLSMKISQIKYNFESESISLTVTNLKDLRDDWQLFLDKIYTASSTSAIVNKHKNLWDGITVANDLVSQILKSEYDTAKNVLLGGSDSTIEISNRGIFNRDPNDTNTWMVINAGILAITADGAKTLEVAISKNGVHANRLVGVLTLSKKLWVEDELGIVTIQSGLQTIYDQNGIPRVFLGRYPTFENPSQFNYGLRVTDGAFDIRTSSTSNSGIVINGTSISAFNNNSVKTFEVDAVTGKVSIIGSLSIKTSIDSNRGTLIDDSGLTVYGNSGQIVFRADHFGNIFYTGKLDGAYGNVQDLTGSIKDMTGSIKDMTGSVSNLTGTYDGEFTTKSLRTISIDAEQITSGKIKSQLIDTNSLTAATIEVDQLRANNAQITDLSAITSNLGDITGGKIEIDTDMRIGDSLYIGHNRDWMTQKSIIFAGSASITYNTDTLTISAIGEVNLQATRVNVIGDLYVNGSPIS